MPYEIVDQYGEVIRTDSYMNPVTGYGGVDDSIANTRFIDDQQLSYSELRGLYKTWLVRRGVELAPRQRLSKGIEFVTNDDDSEGRVSEVEKIEDMIKVSQMWNHLLDATNWEGAFGGALIYFDYGDDQAFGSATVNTFAIPTAIDRSLNFQLRDSQRGLPKKIWVVDRFLATPFSYYTPGVHGADHPKLGEPETYSITLVTTGYSRLVFAHESRCIIFKGLPLPPRDTAENHMWGLSKTQNAYEIGKYFDISLKAMADTFEDFNYKSLQIDNLADLIEKNAWNTIGKMTAMAAKNAHNQNVAVHGANSQLIKTSTTVTGLPDMSTVVSNYVTVAWGYPDSVFFSSKGGALGGNSSESDIQNYFRDQRYAQEHIDRQRIEKFLFLLGVEVKNFPFKFPPLAESSENERLEARKIVAETDAIYIVNGVVSPEEVAVSRFATPETNTDQMIVDFEARKEMTDDEDNGEEDSPDNSKPDDEERTDSVDIEPLYTVTVKKEDIE